MKLQARIVLLCSIALVSMAVLAAVSLSTLRQSMVQERTAQLSKLVILAHSALEKLNAQEQAGQLSRADAQKEGKRIIGSFLKDDQYFFVRGFSDDVNLVHPNPKRVGIVDAKGGAEAGVRYRAALQGKTIGTVVAKGTRPGAKDATRDGLSRPGYFPTRPATFRSRRSLAAHPVCVVSARA